MHTVRTSNEPSSLLRTGCRSLALGAQNTDKVLATFYELKTSMFQSSTNNEPFTPTVGLQGWSLLLRARDQFRILSKGPGTISGSFPRDEGPFQVPFLGTRDQFRILPLGPFQDPFLGTRDHFRILS